MLQSCFLLAATAALALGSSACTLTFTEGEIDDDSSWTSGGWSNSSSSSTGGSDGGATTSAGVGGDPTTGSGGAGGTPTTTGVGGGGETTTGGGGEPQCIDGDGIGMTVAMCDNMAISATNVGVCSDGLEPFGYAVCYRTFDIWQEGYAEALGLCLSTIPAEDACNEDLVIDCVEDIFNDSCDEPYIADTCQSWGDTCSAYGEAFDVAACSNNLNLFSDDGLLELTDCMADVDDTCQARFDECYDFVASAD